MSRFRQYYYDALAFAFLFVFGIVIISPVYIVALLFGMGAD